MADTIASRLGVREFGYGTYADEDEGGMVYPSEGEGEGEHRRLSNPGVVMRKPRICTPGVNPCGPWRAGWGRNRWWIDPNAFTDDGTPAVPDNEDVGLGLDPALGGISYKGGEGGASHHDGRRLGDAVAQDDRR